MAIIERNIAPVVRRAAENYPVVTITGPRQSGKTTLAKALFADYEYLSLEAPDAAEFAREDPRGFLDTYDGRVILDEIQNVPQLLRYLQPLVDEKSEAGRFVLTGSEHFSLSEAISQSLAGRTAIVRLLPCSYDELQRFDDVPDDLWDVVWAGGYPRIFDRGIDPHDWLSNYVATYVQRDVRQVLNVTDLTAFMTFLRLCAGRTAQERNLSNLGGDAGVTHNTARSWLSVLQTGFITFELPPFVSNIRKRLIKAPKLHFLDSGLVCQLLGIRSSDQLVHHPLRGAIFETWVVSEIYKHRAHAGHRPSMYHMRQSRGPEVDCVIGDGAETILVEVKSGATARGEYLRSIAEFAADLEEADESTEVVRRLVYGGDQRQRRSLGEVVPWRQIHDVEWGR